MHSRLFQLSKEPIKKEFYMTTGLLDENTNMLDGWADYFDEETNRDDDIEWLVSVLTEKGLDVKKGTDENGVFITFTLDGLKEYIKNKFEGIKDILDELTEFDFYNEKGLNNLPSLFYALKTSVENKRSFYIWDNDSVSHYTLDNFLIELFGNYFRKPNYKFYIGATIDYL